jgi:general L-amino acid transport system permease protein
MADAAQTYEAGKHPELPPPRSEVGVLGWVRHNLFSSPLNTVMTLLAIWFLWWLIPPLFDWIVLDAIWTADSRKECWDKMEVPEGAACWAFIKNRLQLFIYGFYPEASRWRVNLSFVLLVMAIVPVLYDKRPGRKFGLLYAVAFPFVAGWLLVGGLGLTPVDTDQFGGIMLTLIIGVTGISFSLPIGVLLALGRRSNMPVLRMLCVMFIESMRGVPLIALLFIASSMLNFFLPPGTVFDLLLRVLIMVTLFAAAYIAEVVRGGLQGIPNGQYEAADSLGLTYAKAHLLIILPQALRIVVPPLGNEFIAMIKDTSLLSILSVRDVTQRMREFQSASFLPFAPFNTAAVLYVVITLACASFLKWIERRYERRHA